MGQVQSSSGTWCRAVAALAAFSMVLLGLGVYQASPAHAATGDKIGPAIAAAGAGVLITGTALTTVTGVTFLGAAGSSDDDVAASSFIAVSETKLVVQLPPGAVTGLVELASSTGTAVTAVPAVISQVPQITGLSAPSLPPGATLTISGSNLLGVKKTTVWFDQKKASPLPTSKPHSVQVVVPTGLRGGPLPLSVVTDGGTAEEDFSIAPFVKAIVPPAGSSVGGTTVSILGSGFTGVDRFTDDPSTPDINERFDGVTIGDVRVTKLIAVSDTEIVAVTAPSAPTPSARVVVRTVGDGTVAESANAVGFSYQPRPVVRSLTPDWNPTTAAGGPVAVTATGENLNETTKVLVGTMIPTDVVANAEAGTLTFTPPPAAKEAVTKVTFTNTMAGVAFTTTVPFTTVAAPTATKVTPASGPAGTVVSIAGTGFASGTTATFGSTPAACAVVSLTLLRCTAPEGTGSAAVVVTNGLGDTAAGPAVAFTYLAGTVTLPAAPAVPQPTVSAALPAFGTAGSTIDLKGTNLHLVTKVELTGAESVWVNAAQFQIVGPTRVVVTVPAGAATGPLRVTTPARRVTTDRVIYTAAARPSVASIDVLGDATYGVAGGDLLTIKGAGLVAGTLRPLVTIGGKPAALLARPVPTARTIVVRVPASVGGRERVTVTTPLGSATAEASLYFTPQIKSIKPISYSREGGSVATIAGTGFTGVDGIEEAAGGRLSAVTFGGITVARLVVMSDKEVVVVTTGGSATADLLLVRSQHGTWIGSSDEQVRATNLPVPTISQLSPNVAVLGTAPPQVTIRGTNLRATSSVRFGTAEGVVQSASDDGTSMVVVPPARATAATVGVTVTNVVLGEELVATLPGGFRYVPQPTITGLTPTDGFTGSTPPQVTITGANLRLNSVVRFGDMVAAVDSVSDDGSALVVTPPLRNTPDVVDVTITNLVDDEELSATVAGGYTYRLRAFPTVSDISPNTAVAGSPGSPVTISGSHLYSHSVVRFGSAVGTVVSAADDGTSMVVVPPVGAAGTVTVTVTNSIAGDDLAVTVPAGFRYLPVPTIVSVSPDNGTVSVAQAPVTVAGTNLLANSVVRFGGAAGAIESVAPDGKSLVVTPPSLANPGPVDVTVTNIVDGEPLSATLASGYTYLDGQSPTITSVSPATGVTGTSNPAVTIRGSKLRPDTIVRFGSAQAVVQSVDEAGETMVVVTPPVSTTDGYVAVSVTNVVNGQPLTSALANGYRYLPVPSIGTISPNTGFTGATPPVVTITGTNLRLNTVVRFGSSNATVQSAASDGTSVVVAPPVSNTVGDVEVSVTNIVDGSQSLTATRTAGYRYDLVPAVITAKSAQTALPGTQITLSGTSFSGVTSVRFGTTEAAFTLASSTTLYAIVPVTPAGAQGSTADITVVNATGQPSTAEPATADDWTWAAHPFITAMTPSTGVEASQVTITGTGFTDATAVRFGGIDAAYTVVDDTTVHAVVPTTPSAGSVVDVIVVARGLNTPEPLVSTVNDWTWHPIAVITLLNPNPGAAGATITVSGRNFTNVRRVTVNGTDVTNTVAVQSSTSLTFTAPPRPGGGGTARTDKPVYIYNGSNAQSTAETLPTGKAANLFTWS